MGDDQLWRWRQRLGEGGQRDTGLVGIWPNGCSSGWSGLGWRVQLIWSLVTLLLPAQEFLPVSLPSLVLGNAVLGDLVDDVDGGRREDYSNDRLFDGPLGSGMRFLPGPGVCWMLYRGC